MKEASAINTKPCKPIGLRSEAHQHLCPKALQFLSFTMGQEEYGIDIQKVQKLRGYDMDRLISSDEMGLIEKLAA